MDTIEAAIAAFRNGEMVVVVDDEQRENEGDLIMAAEKVTPQAINFMISEGKGLVCAPICERLAQKLELHHMVTRNTDMMGTAFTVSVDATAKHGVTTGISPADRAKTISLLVDPQTTAADLNRPGHIFPLIAKAGGVLRRAGHTEAAVDLARLAGLKAGGVLCEIIAPDGQMMRTAQLVVFAQKHGLKMISIKDLIDYRLKNDSEDILTMTVAVNLPSKYGDFKVIGFEDPTTKEHHLAIIKGELGDGEDILLRVHSECLTGDVLGSQRCDCGDQLATALKMIEKQGRGLVLYMRQEGRGIGLINKLKAYNLQDQGMDTVEANHCLGFEADLRDYGVGARILKKLGIKTVRLLTNNPKKIIGLSAYGIKIKERIPLVIAAGQYNEKYLQTKADKLGHLFNNESAQ